jgi:hypothetical protein
MPKAYAPLMDTEPLDHRSPYPSTSSREDSRMTEESRLLQAEIHAHADLSGSLSAHVFVGLARDHLVSACRLARLAYRLEHDGPSPEAGTAREEHDTFVIGSIVFAGAFLDGEINSLYANAAEGADPNALPAPMRGELRQDVADSFRSGADFRKMSTLDKYQNLLKLAGRGPLSEKPGTPHARALLLTQVRNRLIHFQEGPVLMSSGGTDPIPLGRFEEQLTALEIARSPLAAAGEPFFPRGMLSHQLASSGVEWAVAWVDAFYVQLGVTSDPLGALRSATRTTA